MTISGAIYIGVLSLLFGGSLSLIHEYRKKWNSVLSELADDIRRYNSRNAYGQSVSKIELARDYAVPLRRESLADFADANGITVETYERELDQNVGKPTIHMIGYTVQILTFLYTISGISYFIPGFIVAPVPFLIIGGILIVICFGFYLFI